MALVFYPRLENRAQTRPSQGGMQDKSVLERAFELADSGEFSTVTELKLMLAREGYRGLGPLMQGKSLRDQLKARMKRARVADKALDSQSL